MSHRRSRHVPASSADRPTAPPPTNPEAAAEEYLKLAVIAEAEGGDFTECPLTPSELGVVEDFRLGKREGPGFCAQYILSMRKDSVKQVRKRRKRALIVAVWCMCVW